MLPRRMLILSGGAPPWVASGAKADLDFVNGLYYPINSLTGMLSNVRSTTGYDQPASTLFAIDTLRRTLIEEMLIVSLVIFIFLLHVRSALVPILTLPIGVLLAFVPMFY